MDSELRKVEMALDLLGGKKKNQCQCKTSVSTWPSGNKSWTQGSEHQQDWPYTGHNLKKKKKKNEVWWRDPDNRECFQNHLGGCAWKHWWSQWPDIPGVFYFTLIAEMLESTAREGWKNRHDLGSTPVTTSVSIISRLFSINWTITYNCSPTKIRSHPTLSLETRFSSSGI